MKKFFKRWMAQPAPTFSHEHPYDVVVPLDYGTLPTGELPQAATIAMTEACTLIKEKYAKHVAWSNTTYFGPGFEHMNQKKREILKHQYVPENLILAETSCTNSITEAKSFLSYFKPTWRIVVICDWVHAPRARIIWKRIYPQAQIDFLVFSADWNEDHPSPWQRSNLRWFIANGIHWFLLKTLGMNYMERVTHPVKNSSHNKNT